MRYIACSLGLATLAISGCAPIDREPALTQLQVREIQTREFETMDVKLVMKGMMNVLQDDGYIIKNAVLDLGLLSAEKDIDVSSRAEYFWPSVSKRDDGNSTLSRKSRQTSAPVASH